MIEGLFDIQKRLSHRQPKALEIVTIYFYLRNASVDSSIPKYNLKKGWKLTV